MALSIRTDIASEAHKIWQQEAEDTSLLPGVKARQEDINGLSVTSVEILDEEGAKALSKPLGKYFTLELEPRFERGAQGFPASAQAISQLLERCIEFGKESSFLIAALGNPDITPDALGSIAASNIIVTRHLKSSSPEQFSAFTSTTLCRTGVLGTTGIESAVQIKTLCGELSPTCVIAIDALAGSDVSRLCRTIQISDSGIAPGSGIGNSREELSRAFLGVPVVSIGMPTVIDAAHFSDEPAIQSMFVTPRGIDSSVRAAGRLIAYGINLALHKGLSISDIDMLVG